MGHGTHDDLPPPGTGASRRYSRRTALALGGAAALGLGGWGVAELPARGPAAPQRAIADGSSPAPMASWDVTRFGATGNGAADDTTSIQMAIEAASGEGGGIVFFPAGTYVVSRPLTLPASRANPSISSPLLFMGSGRSATTLLTRVDTVVLDLSGQVDGSGTVTRRASTVTVQDLEVRSVYGRAAANPLVRCYYAQKLMFLFVDVFGPQGVGLRAVELWDSYFHGCRFDSSGGADGRSPAVLLQQSDPGSVPGDFGWSSDNTNNIWMVNCVFEAFQDGALWALGGGPGDRAVNLCHFVNIKMETTMVTGPFVRLENVQTVSFGNLDCALDEPGPAFVGPIDVISMSSSNDLRLSGCLIITSRQGPPLIRAGVHLDNVFLASVDDPARCRAGGEQTKGGSPGSQRGPRPQPRNHPGCRGLRLQPR